MTFSRRAAIVASCLAFFGLGQRSVRSATEATGAGFLELVEPLSLPISELTGRWDIVRFDAGLSTPKGNRRLQGVVLKTGNDPVGTDDLQAFCTICPHEICLVEFVEETARYTALSDAVTGQPLFVCPCHFSVFDPVAKGEVLAGPAPRGLYAFEFQVTDDEIRITGIEAGVLKLLS